MRKFLLCIAGWVTIDKEHQGYSQVNFGLGELLTAEASVGSLG